MRAPLCAALIALLVSAGPLFAQELFPRPSGPVADYAQVIPAEIEAGMDGRLRGFEAETSAALVVATVPNLGGNSIEGYAVRLFEAWEIGQKGQDNGILLLLAVEERLVRVEVGYGMEPYLTDGQAGRIVDAEVFPSLKAGNYGEGLDKGSQAIARAVLENGYEARPSKNPVPVMGLLTAALYAAAYMARTREVLLGGILGAIGGGIAGWMFGGLFGTVMGVIGAGVAGLLLDIVLSSAYRHQVRTGGPTSWGSSWGGFRGAGHWGGRGGGGFGGFGGGRSGGGGASRRF